MKPKPYGDNRYTEAQMRAFIIAGLRDKSMRWSCKTNAKRLARDGYLVNPETGKNNLASKCASCGKRVFEKEAVVDHIEPVVPVEGFTGETWLSYNWTEYLRRLFCDVDGFQVLCKSCHKIKSQKESEERRKNE